MHVFVISFEAAVLALLSVILTYLIFCFYSYFEQNKWWWLRWHWKSCIVL